MRRLPTLVGLGGIVLLAALAAWAAASGLRRAERGQALSELSVQTQREADALLGRTLAGRAMGAMVLAGQMEGPVQSAARAPDALRGEPGARLSEALETLARSVEADAAWVLNEQGRVVGAWELNAEGAGRKSLGQSLRQRPHVVMAREQVESVYARVEQGEGARDLQLAAPIYAEPGNFSSVQGVLLMRLPLAQIDRSLALAAELALLVSPTGQVFAASRPDLHGLRADAVTEPLGPAWLRSEAELGWNDVQGPWRLLLLRQAPAHSLQGLALAALVGAGVAALALALWRAMRHGAARRAAVAQQAETAELLATKARWQTEVAALGAKLQQSREVGALAACFFEGLAALLPLHQASLYQAGRPLRRLAQWGGCAVPEVIEPGQGLVGECALSAQALWLDAPPPDYWTLRTGLFEGQARALVVLPVMRSDTLVAVLELASLQSELLTHRATLEALLPVLAVNLEAALEAAPRRMDA